MCTSSNAKPSRFTAGSEDITNLKRRRLKPTGRLSVATCHLVSSCMLHSCCAPALLYQFVPVPDVPSFNHVMPSAEYSTQPASHNCAPQSSTSMARLKLSVGLAIELISKQGE